MLEVDDLALLIEAMELWKEEPQRIQASTLALMVLTNPDMCNYENVVDFHQKTHGQADEETDGRSERTILIQAKLIQMKDSLIAETAIGG